MPLVTMDKYISRVVCAKTEAPAKPVDKPRHKASIYARNNLDAETQMNLAVLAHFVLLFRSVLDLPAFALLHDEVEQSLFSHSGKPFLALVEFLALATASSVSELKDQLFELRGVHNRLAFLRQLVDDNANHPSLRAALVGDDGRVLSAARLGNGMKDSKGVEYIWLRGPDGCCSDRVVMNNNSTDPKVLRSKEIIQRVSQFENGIRKRADLLTASWLRERVDRAMARSKKVEVAEEERVKKEAEMEEERKRKEKEKEEERKSKVERFKRQVGLMGGKRVEVEHFGRGRRKRKAVVYEEEEEEEEDEDVDEDEDEFMLEGESENDNASEQSEQEEVLDEGDGAEFSDEEEEDFNPVRMGSPRAVGRVRVHSDSRITRSQSKQLQKEERAGRKVNKIASRRPVRKCRRLVRLTDE